MKEFIKGLPEIIKASSQSPLAIVALVIIAITIIACFVVRPSKVQPKGYSRKEERTGYLIRIFILLIVGCFLLLVIVIAQRLPPPPPPPPPVPLAIKIIIVPPADPGGPNSSGEIAGKIEGLDGQQSVTNYAVVVYAKTTSWYVEPETDNSLTEIGLNGEWSNKIHLGWRYAVILVKKPFTPPNTFPGPYIPQLGNFLCMTNFDGTR